jgi:hypothetical protein
VDAEPFSVGFPTLPIPGRPRLIGCAVLDEEDFSSGGSAQGSCRAGEARRSDAAPIWGPIHQHADQNLGGCWSTGNFVDTKETVLVINFSRAILQDRPGEACLELS